MKTLVVLSYPSKYEVSLNDVSLKIISGIISPHDFKIVGQFIPDLCKHRCSQKLGVSNCAAILLYFITYSTLVVVSFIFLGLKALFFTHRYQGSGQKSSRQASHAFRCKDLSVV
jgi:hypothetical protein